MRRHSKWVRAAWVAACVTLPAAWGFALGWAWGASRPPEVRVVKAVAWVARPGPGCESDWAQAQGHPYDVGPTDVCYYPGSRGLPAAYRAANGLGELR